MFRPREYKREERENEKLTKRESWFQGKSKAESVIFVTATPDSQLAKTIQAKLDQANIPVKVAEQSGTKISQLLVRTDPHQTPECGRPGCLVCEGRSEEDKGSSCCRKEGVTYSLTCLACPEEERGKLYVGQTSSTAYIRGGEHKRQLRLHMEGKKGGEDSVMGRHVLEKHQGNYEGVDFSMQVLSQHLGNPHGRQVWEAMWMEEFGCDNLINTRSEMSSDLASRAGTSISRTRQAAP